MKAQQSAFVRTWTKQCCTVYKSAEEKEKHMLREHLVNILEEQVRPNFQKHSHPALDKRLQNGRYVDKTISVDFHDNQLWKEAGSSGYASIDIVEWIIQSATVTVPSLPLHCTH